MSVRQARFSKSSSIDALRSALIAQDLDDLSDADIADIAATYWEEFERLAVRYLDKKWNDGSDVWLEAEQRGYFEDEWERDA